MWGDIAIAFLLAFIVTFMATPYTIKIAHKVGAVDVPKDQRRMHKKAMPKFGGPAVILGFLVSVIYLLIVMSIENSINLFGIEQYGKKLLGMFFGILIISIVCIVDDIKTIKPITKLIGQTLAAIITVAFGVRIEDITLPFLNTIEMQEMFSIIITIIWIVGVTNAINLINSRASSALGASDTSKPFSDKYCRNNRRSRVSSSTTKMCRRSMLIPFLIVHAHRPRPLRRHPSNDDLKQRTYLQHTHASTLNLHR